MNILMDASLGVSYEGAERTLKRRLVSFRSTDLIRSLFSGGQSYK